MNDGGLDLMVIRDRPQFKPGLFHDMPASTYHEIEALSSSGAKKMIRSAAHYKLMRDTPSVPSAQMQFGTVVHAGVLEPDTFDQVVAISPDCDKRTVAGKATWANFYSENAGRIILTAADHDRARRCIDAVNAHPAAAKLLDGAKREVSLFWNDARYGCPCKSRFDIYSHGGIADLKTCQDGSSEGFGKTIAQYLYHMAAAFYVDAAEHVLNESPRFFCFVVVEVEPPFAVAVYRLPTNAILAGAHLVAKAMERYAEALATGQWRGYPITIDDIQLPGWALKFNN
jgi:hypothetical protein